MPNDKTAAATALHNSTRRLAWLHVVLFEPLTGEALLCGVHAHEPLRHCKADPARTATRNQRGERQTGAVGRNKITCRAQGQGQGHGVASTYKEKKYTYVCENTHCNIQVTLLWATQAQHRKYLCRVNIMGRPSLAKCSGNTLCDGRWKQK